MQEFIYYNPNGIEFPLPESIFVTKQLNGYENNNFLVSNSSSTNSEFVAKEIDFYIKNSKDSLSEKIKNTEKLYEINAIKFDFSQDTTYLQEMSNKILLICNEDEKKEFLSQILPDEFELYHITENLLEEIKGQVSDFTVLIKDEEKIIELKVEQIVWFDCKIEKNGCIDPSKSSLEKTLKQIRENISLGYEYKKYLNYDSSICQYHKRLHETCAKCVEVCPTETIIKDEAKKHLEFSQIDCLGCGGCISVCPSGALDYTAMTKEAIFEMSRLYDGHIPLIIPDKMGISSLNISLKEKVLPFKIGGEKFLDESSLLTLLQESGSQIVFYTDFLSKGTSDAIYILNQIYQKKFAKDAVLLAKNQQELESCLKEVSFIENSRYKLSNMELKKRELFAIRLAYIVANEDLGIIHTGENIHYAQVKVNQDKCTLCLSCVGACNVEALVADASDNTLRLNASLCTSCGYCEVTCPEENCLSIQKDVIKLNPLWFKEEILAKDELFACIECGKEFATTKAIQKVAAVMKPFFASNPVKLRTLYCCEDCKAKLMIKQGLLNE